MGFLRSTKQLVLELGSRIWMLFVFALVPGLGGCYYDKVEKLYPSQAVDCSSIQVSYAADVAPVIKNNCATTGCHNSAGAGSTVLQTYAQVFAKRELINQRTLVTRSMPPAGSLNSNEIKILYCWIAAGAPDN